ncbi:hypothetical protein K440DRAFT_159391 [Wilcoxina mikolae CBS 423.85]|nr:hypothetical protein K440DRAFT_159391 [Wilcoxina mikolae CBS 423.85]
MAPHKTLTKISALSSSVSGSYGVASTMSLQKRELVTCHSDAKLRFIPDSHVAFLIVKTPKPLSMLGLTLDKSKLDAQLEFWRIQFVKLLGIREHSIIKTVHVSRVAARQDNQVKVFAFMAWSVTSTLLVLPGVFVEMMV